MACNVSQWAQAAGEEAYEVTCLVGTAISKRLGLHPRGGADVQDNSRELADFVARLALRARVPAVDGGEVDLREASVSFRKLQDYAL